MVLRVAVIGCGAAGLCALRHLAARSSVFSAVGFEQMSQPGGTWIYTDQVGTDKNGLPVQSSMYKNLRTNLPKEVMAFPDYPFPSKLSSFVKHEDVLEYLQSYCQHYDLTKFIKYETKVDLVEPIVSEDNKTEWRVCYSSVKNPSSSDSITVDAVMVCNGHFAIPLSPSIPGMSEFQGTILHSHEYREPEMYKDQTVVCLGAAASGQDIAMDLVPHANKVILSHNKPTLKTVLPDNVVQQNGISRLTQNTAVFKNGQEEALDTLILCTGYKYNFSFLSEKCHPIIEDERVTPLYKHVIHADWPSLSIIGVCKLICPFPLFYCQVKFVLAALEGTMTLPNGNEMKKDIENDFQARLKEGLPVRYAHTMGSRQWGYNDEMAKLGNFTPVPKVVRNIYDEVHEVRRTDLPNYKKKSYVILDEENFNEL